MQISQLQVNGLKQEYKVIVPAKDIEKKVEERLQAIGKNVRLPGFRPGKTPFNILKQRYGGQALEEALNHTVNSSVGQIIKDNSLRQATQPNVSIVTFDEGKDLELKVDVEVLPEIQVKDFSKISLEKLKVEITDAEITKKIDELLAGHKKYQELTKERAAKKGDMLHLDVSVEVAGKPFAGFGKQMQVVLGAEEKLLFGNIESALEGAKLHGKVDVDDQFPDDFGDKKLAGQPVKFHFTITKIEEPIKFKLDEAFVKEMGCETVDDLKNRIKESLDKEYSNLARLRLKRHLLDNLSDVYKFDLPETLVKNEFEGIWKRLQDELAHAKEQGTLEPEDDRPEEELRQEYQGIAERRVRLGLVISEVSRLNKINVSEEEIRQAIFQEAMRYPRQMKEVFEFYRKNPQAVDHLAAPILEDKVVDFILAGASLKEKKVSTDQLIELIRGVVPGFEEETSDKPKAKKPKAAAKSKTAKAKGAE
ncbi:trigger factor [Candidatus Paracaedibacter symbiosus]|uniref:trigger factor n=1 Tax=Candidatus Paracaedibacter symbiosus TaxID=244582 RepID=UPI000509BD51|nr:trigger factor [Candidatus Paracaedibacter symbiosus]